MTLELVTHKGLPPKKKAIKFNGLYRLKKKREGFKRDETRKGGGGALATTGRLETRKTLYEITGGTVSPRKNLRKILTLKNQQKKGKKKEPFNTTGTGGETIDQKGGATRL